MKKYQQSAKNPKAVEDCHELIAWIIPQIEKFPRSRRFTLGERIEQGLLDVLELLIEAAYSRNKAPLLTRANLRLDVVRHLWRLSSRLVVVSDKSWRYGAGLLVSLGSQIGGWRKVSVGH